jgi:hypothetical protein
LSDEVLLLLSKAGLFLVGYKSLLIAYPLLSSVLIRPPCRLSTSADEEVCACQLLKHDFLRLFFVVSQFSKSLVSALSRLVCPVCDLSSSAPSLASLSYLLVEVGVLRRTPCFGTD